ncbi:nitrate reductase [Thiospirillum jenense]|uniref:Nitrate reductase n=2 Tax=Thiospirillum jenense TaxID=1653858 RepID=A0A839HGY2_9GAMM|nr:nitrate reductase [Thiospirillum jenense]
MKPPEDHRACLRCHAMKTLAYRDPLSKKIITLVIDPSGFEHSVHGQLNCRECHEQHYQRYPHSERARAPLHCVKCHEDGKKQAQHQSNHQPPRQYQFTTIEQEFKRSVHATSDEPDAQDFNCHSCHNPHQFQRSQIGKPLAQVVRDDNAICLSCHEQRFDSLETTHAWLPRRDKHWQAVRCLECHTPLSTTGQPVSHQILAAADSKVDCVNCHSQDAQLLTRLYQYRSQEDVARTGFIAKAVFNDAYIIGMSRSPIIDFIGLLMIALTALVLIGHGWGRYRAAQQLSRGSQ